MSNKTLDILKGSFFTLIFIFCLISRIKERRWCHLDLCRHGDYRYRRYRFLQTRL